MNYYRKSRLAGIVIVACLLTILCGTYVCASPMDLPEELEQLEAGGTGQLVYLTETTNGYEEADESSNVIEKLEKDSRLVMVRQIDEEWCEVINAGRIMYIQLKYIKEVRADESLQQEMVQLEQARVMQAVQDVQARKKILRGRIWGCVIALLIAGIFAVGIVAAVRSRNEES